MESGILQNIPTMWAVDDSSNEDMSFDSGKGLVSSQSLNDLSQNNTMTNLGEIAQPSFFLSLNIIEK